MKVLRTSGGILAAVLLAIQLAALALGGAASCPSNLANDLAEPPPPASSQLITVAAQSARATIGKATSGCISLHRSALVHVLRWLDPGALPQIAIGTTRSLRQR